LRGVRRVQSTQTGLNILDILELRQSSIGKLVGSLGIPRLIKTFLDDLLEYGTWMLRFRAVARHDPIQQDNASRRCFHLGLCIVIIGFCRSYQKSESKGGKCSDNGGGKPDDILGLGVEMMLRQTHSSEHAKHGCQYQDEEYQCSKQ